MSFSVQKPRFIFLSRTLYLVYVWVHTDPCHYPSRLDLLSKGLIFVIFLIVAASESLKKKIHWRDMCTFVLLQLLRNDSFLLPAKGQ